MSPSTRAWSSQTLPSLRPEVRAPPGRRRGRGGREGHVWRRWPRCSRRAHSTGRGKPSAVATEAGGSRGRHRPEQKRRLPPDPSGRGQNEGRKAARPAAPAGSHPPWGGRPSGPWSCGAVREQGGDAAGPRGGATGDGSNQGRPRPQAPRQHPAFLNVVFKESRYHTRATEPAS